MGEAPLPHAPLQDLKSSCHSNATERRAMSNTNSILKSTPREFQKCGDSDTPVIHAKARTQGPPVSVVCCYVNQVLAIYHLRFISPYVHLICYALGPIFGGSTVLHAFFLSKVRNASFHPTFLMLISASLFFPPRATPLNVNKFFPCVGNFRGGLNEKSYCRNNSLQPLNVVGSFFLRPSAFEMYRGLGGWCARAFRYKCCSQLEQVYQISGSY